MLDRHLEAILSCAHGFYHLSAAPE